MEHSIRQTLSCGKVARMGIALVVVAMGAGIFAQEGLTQPVEIPPTAILEGVPSVRIDSDERTTTRRVLGTTEADEERLRVRVVDGRFYWSSRNDRPLHLESSGAFTYLTGSEPGRYIRLTRVNDRITYVEHVDMSAGSITWWGELTIVVGK